MSRSRGDFSAVFAAARCVYGTWTQCADADLIDMLGASGYDFTIIDCEHGSLDLGDLPALVRACEAAALLPIVRSPGVDAGWIGKALDAGVRGLVIPGVESARQIECAIAATRFAPEGTRGACPIVRAGSHWVSDWPAYRAREHRSVGVMALIETAAGVGQAEAICAVPGLAGLVLGPFDLSVSMGLDGDYRDDRVQHALIRMVKAAAEQSIPVMAPVFAIDPGVFAEQIRHWSGLGVRVFAVGSDKTFFVSASSRYLADARAAAEHGRA